jgi:superfamily II DNA or RNA helicase
MLAVSATPDRTDKAEKAIEGVADVCVTLREAVEEGAIRPVTVRSSDYAIDITLKGESTPRRMSTAELHKKLAESGADISVQEVKRELRYYSKYLYKAILDAYMMLNQLNIAQPGEHKMIAFAMGVGHAKAVCDQINGIAGKKVADWIGVQSSVTKDDGSSVTIGRSDKENKAILDNFKAGKFNVLVQVKKATEGFNDVRCSVLLFLNMAGETVQLKQMIGRGLRRNYAVEPNTGKRAERDCCWIFVSSDHPGLEYMKRLEADVKDPEEEDEPESSSSTGDSSMPIYGIPEFYILDAEFKSEELFYPFGEEGRISETEATTRVRAGVPELAAADDATVQAQLRKLFGMDPKPISTSERLDSSRKKITKVAQVLAGNVVRVRAERCGGTFPQSLLGDTVRAIHSRWLQQFPGLTHDLMSPDELEQKYEWIRGINNGMKEAPDAYAFLVSEAPWLLL